LLGRVIPLAMLANYLRPPADGPSPRSALAESAYQPPLIEDRGSPARS
jgi:hypothetical protein